MQLKTHSTSPSFDGLNSALKLLKTHPSFPNARQVVESVLSLLGATQVTITQVDFGGKIDRLLKLAHGFGDRFASYEIEFSNNKNLNDNFEAHLFWLHKPTKRNIKNITTLNSNFEDEPMYASYKIGIDIIIAPNLESVSIVLSNNYKLRVLELQNILSNTQQKIFEHWHRASTLKTKKELHELLWNSFSIQPLNEEFYSDIHKYFVELISHFNKNDIFENTDRPRFVNRLIGRMLFCWFLKKKELISPKQNYFEVETLNSTDYYKQKLHKLFFQTLNTPQEERGLEIDADLETPYLNGGLFELKETDKEIINKKYHTKIHIFPIDYFKKLIKTLTSYNFTTDESTQDYQQIAIDPEMLGKIFEELLSQELTDSGKSERKSKGAYYTTKEIVEYMCKESLQAYLINEHKNEPNIREFIDQVLEATNNKNQTTNNSNFQHLKYKVQESLDNIKIIDPACGSGAFPISMLLKLIAYYEQLDSDDDKLGTKDRYKTKLKIIKNNIYGVDIEPMAVEIARLRAWLTLIVDATLKPSLSNSGIDELPNLDFKFICADSLMKLDTDTSFFEHRTLFKDISELIKAYFKPSDKKQKQKIQDDYEKLISKLPEQDTKSVQHSLSSYRPFTPDSQALFFNSELMFGGIKEFDIVISNPPYVSTKGISEEYKKQLKKYYNYSDDLYSHFFFKGIELCKKEGIVAYITSNTYYSTVTKTNLREELLKNKILILFDTENPFDKVLVSTSVVILQKTPPNSNTIKYLTLKNNDVTTPIETTILQKTYCNATNNVIFKPTPLSMLIYDRYNQPIKKLLLTHQNIMGTATKIKNNKSYLDKYGKELLPGDITLMGLITQGGQGLATANNGKFVGVLQSTKEATTTSTKRIKKLTKFLIDNNIKTYGTNEEKIQSALDTLTEYEIRDIIDALKNKYDRDILSRGFLYRIVDKSEVKDVNKITETEKLEGIKRGPTFVPYEKGDKDGNRWYLRTPYYIDWSYENVKWLKDNTGKKDIGMPRFQNSHFYFKEGFCWSDIHTLNVKARIKSISVHDVKSMSLSSTIKTVSDKFIICILNSSFINKYISYFICNTQTFQINDARLVPIVIPTPEQHREFIQIYDKAYKIKCDQFDKVISEPEAESALIQVERLLDEKVCALYGIDQNLLDAT
ncbi:MAG: Eco57I restriction-modification methylase domain-containing protein [Methylacidiphilales bacterium]|nr:Eco57I restriction-modification methylase domain-containing protein [Candidatus Methylacidiphilales bacterium]